MRAKKKKKTNHKNNKECFVECLCGRTCACQMLSFHRPPKIYLLFITQYIAPTISHFFLHADSIGFPERDPPNPDG